MKDYYKILNVRRNASSKEIKFSYRKLAMEWHPDRNKNPNSTLKFIEINEAYEILIDSFKRKEYDEIYISNDISDQFFKWQREAENNAKTYAKMNFDEYKSSILNEIKLAASYSPAFGCFVLLIIFAIINLYGAIEMGFMGIFSGLVFSIAAIFVYSKYIKSYIEDRKDLKR